MKPYAPEHEEMMRRFYNSLNEKDGRRFAGFEALRFGHGGRSYIARVLGCSRNTVSKGAREVSGLPKGEVEQRIRKPGGGRKPYYVTWGAQLAEKFLAVLREHTAGDPMDERVRWTNLTPGEIVAALRAEHDIVVSKYVVRKLLQKHNYRRRKAQKKLGGNRPTAIAPPKELVCDWSGGGGVRSVLLEVVPLDRLCSWPCAPVVAHLCEKRDTCGNYWITEKKFYRFLYFGNFVIR